MSDDIPLGYPGNPVLGERAPEGQEWKLVSMRDRNVLLGMSHSEQIPVRSDYATAEIDAARAMRTVNIDHNFDTSGGYEDGSLDAAIDGLTAARRAIPVSARAAARFEIDVSEYSVTSTISHKRMETDAEVVARLQSAERSKKIEEANGRRQLVELQKRYGEPPLVGK